MIKRNGKAYVVLEFDDETDAAFFEVSFNDQVWGDLVEAAGEGKLANDAFAGQDEVNVTNNASGDVNGTLFQAGVIGRREF